MAKSWVSRLVGAGILGIVLANPARGQGADPEVVSAYRRALGSPVEVRIEALRQIQALAANPNSDDVAKSLVLDVIGLLRRDPNPALRREAVRTLAAIQVVEAIDALHEALSSSDSAVRFEAVRSLGSVGDQSSLSFLARRLSDPVPYVRIAAIRSVQMVQSRLARGQGPARE